MLPSASIAAVAQPVRTRNARLLLLAAVGASETGVSTSPGLMLFDMYLTSFHSGFSNLISLSGDGLTNFRVLKHNRRSLDLIILAHKIKETAPATFRPGALSLLKRRKRV
jgi:hypothetical protein